MNKILLILIVFNFDLYVFGQSQKQLDSLVHTLPTIKNDTLKARTFLKIAEKYFFIDVEKALYYDRLGLKQAEKMNWDRGVAVFNGGIGRAYSDKGNYDSSLYYFQKALVINKKNSDYWNMASTLNNLGAVEQNIKSDYPKATKYYFEALKVAEKVEDKYITAICFDNISNVYLFQKNYKKALEYAFKGLNLRKSFKSIEKTNVTNSIEIGNSLVSIGNIYIELGDISQGKKYLIKAIDSHQNAENKLGLAKSYSNLALTFSDDIDKKIKFSLIAKKLWKEVNPNNLEAISNTANLGNWYFELFKKNHEIGNRNLAEKYLIEAIHLSEINGEKAYKANNLGNLAEIQAVKGDFKNAYLNFRAYQNAQDSLYSQKTKNEIAGLETKREVEIRDKEIQLKNLALETQKKQRIGYLVGLLLLTTIGGLLFYQNQNRKKSNQKLQKLNEELDEANKTKAKFFAILSHDLRSPVSNLINFLHLQKEAPELLSPEIKQRNELKISDAAENLLENMESMLLWSKSQMMNFEPKFKPVFVADLFDFLEKNSKNETNIEFKFENYSNLVLNTDEDYLKTILQNLNQNAIKAFKNRPSGKINWNAENNDNKIVISILDNAGGMPAEAIHNLTNGTGDLGGRSGFGLILVRDFSQKIGCEIQVKVVENESTEIILLFNNSF